jgi:predicted ribosome-associated RNA-binding protein Tma20
MSNNVEHLKTTSKQIDEYKDQLVICQKTKEELEKKLEEKSEIINSKDDLILKKDEKLKQYGDGPKPVIINKLEKKIIPTLETKIEKKSTKIKQVKDAGSF